jgi:hypothetical protein
MSTVTSVSAFLAGFSLAAVVVIADAPEHFRWAGVAVLALTIASVVLIVVAQASRLGAYYYERYKDAARSREYREKWRTRIWALYHAGIIALLAGLGAALVPRDGVGGQQGLRWLAACVAGVTAIGEVLVAIKPRAKRAAKWIGSRSPVSLRRGG